VTPFKDKGVFFKVASFDAFNDIGLFTLYRAVFRKQEIPRESNSNF
jgi:hypothetical protein